MPIDQYEPVFHISLRTYESVSAYANPTRMAILSILAEEECTLSMLASKLDTAPANLSHHIRKLLEAKLIVLVETRATARNVEKYYRASARSYSVERREGASSDARLDAEAFFRSEIIAAFAQRGSPGGAAAGGGPASFAKLASARIRHEDAAAFGSKLEALAREFSSKDGSDGLGYSLGLAFFPND